ncbi:MAG: two-component system, chemotaxis family, protein-glutamate methylesterase/glutaminase, partial [Thermomicrobiales bacterium]|nr:two-component system, chemotaxis family, protein-glutamate methylesterase/glutaminase [Thermomicrobiales bacterium]
MGSPTREVTSPRLAEESVGQGRDVVVVGASAGGIQALLAMVQGLPADFPAAVFVVVHTTPHTPSVLPRLLERAGQLPAGHARHGEAIVGGRIYVAPPDYHTLVEPGHFALSTDAPVRYSRPSIDVTFSSAADSYAHRTVGVVLTGANADGADGLRRISDRGGLALVQDPDSAESRLMPAAAQRAVPRARVMSLEGII